MKVNGLPYRTVWEKPGSPGTVCIIDQRHLPFAFVIEELGTVGDVAVAIRDMHVRGAGCIGATAAWGMAIAACEHGHDHGALRDSGKILTGTRPTAVNLQWAVERQLANIEAAPANADLAEVTRSGAQAIADDDVDSCRCIGQHGVELLAEIAASKPVGEPVNILTHCNAGWLAFVDTGSATAPIYAARDAGIPVHVWVDETRPRNQGSRLTAWELFQEGIPHTVIADNTGGHLMQNGMVDIVITGTDRTARNGDVANKIGTYLKALAARDNGIPFYVALPSSSIDWNCDDGVREIPIEERGGGEVRFVDCLIEGHVEEGLVTNPESAVANYAFDVTPARLISGLITERGTCTASVEGLQSLFPERGATA